jgi:23S rRNA pseudouridine2605 synthase
VNPLQDKIQLNGQDLPHAVHTTSYLVYKPAGFVSTTNDELGRPTVIDYLVQVLNKPQKLPRLYPVGRLDLDSEGLMLLTNDGSLTHLLTHPSFEVPKTYQVFVAGVPSQKALAHLEQGVKLSEGFTAPAQVKLLKSEGDGSWVEVTIHEGRYHQVKRMFQRVGYDVLRLIRVKLGPFSLADLKGQKYLLLSPKQSEIALAQQRDYSRKTQAHSSQESDENH